MNKLMRGREGALRPGDLGYVWPPNPVASSSRTSAAERERSRSSRWHEVANDATIWSMHDDARQLQGEIQKEVMKAVWRTGGGTVEEIRAAMPADYRSGYNTMQTLLNRLAERGLLSRTPGTTPRGPSGKIGYRPTISEENYLAQSIDQLLAEASPEARDVVITRLIGQADHDAPPAARSDTGGRSKRP